MSHAKRLRELNEAGAKLDAARENGVSGDAAVRATLSEGLQWRDQAANARPTLELAEQIIEAAREFVEADAEYGRLPSPENALDVANAYAELEGALEQWEPS